VVEQGCPGAVEPPEEVVEEGARVEEGALVEEVVEEVVRVEAVVACP